LRHSNYEWKQGVQMSALRRRLDQAPQQEEQEEQEEQEQEHLPWQEQEQAQAEQQADCEVQAAQEAAFDQSWLENVVRRGGGGGGGQEGESIKVVSTRASFGSHNPQGAVDGERGLQKGGAWVVHGDIQGGFALVALRRRCEIRVINVFSGVGLADGHVTDVKVWVSASEHDPLTGQRLLSNEMMALKAQWLPVDTCAHSLQTIVPEREEGEGETRVRSRVRGWVKRVNAEMLTINLESLALQPGAAEVQGCRRWGAMRPNKWISGVLARAVKIKIMGSDAANNGSIVSEIEVLAPPEENARGPHVKGLRRHRHCRRALSPEDGEEERECDEGSAPPSLRVLWPHDGAGPQLIV
jgi:hypothetical protein